MVNPRCLNIKQQDVAILWGFRSRTK